MAAEAVFPVTVGVFHGGVGLEEEEGPNADLPAPQLVMLANVALTSDGMGGVCEGLGGAGEERQMAELQPVATNYSSDSEDDDSTLLQRYGSYEHTHAHTYTEPPQPQTHTHTHTSEERGVAGEEEEEEDEEEEEEEEDVGGAEDLSTSKAPPPKTAAAQASLKRRPYPILQGAVAVPDASKKRKPFHCKPCQYQAQSEEDFIQHIRLHSAKKLIVVNGASGAEEPASDRHCWAGASPDRPARPEEARGQRAWPMGKE
ncbi:hypothetical protein AALO_G00190060 [Alosa alosa]|uniref:C2H2-type domain-containing protein n=1 Tax=Alosa alosa TaxID=278164 RepID=A0AAV6G9P6_9TELE|nr:hypothetical protein AALO_G00190060 [Alosa alosa]